MIPSVFGSLVRSFAHLKSAEIVLEFNDLIDVLHRRQPWRPNSEMWPGMATNAQAAIDEAIADLRQQPADSDSEPGANTPNEEPRVKTLIYFAPDGSRCFFLSSILHPVPPVNGQPLWDVSLCLDAHCLYTSRRIRAKCYNLVTVGTAYKEALAMAYHTETGVLAYTASFIYYDRSQSSRGPHFFVSNLYITGTRFTASISGGHCDGYFMDTRKRALGKGSYYGQRAVLF
jgi:hypothetical protein